VGQRRIFAHRASLRIERARAIAELSRSRGRNLSEELDAPRRLVGSENQYFQSADEPLPILANLVDAFENRRGLAAKVLVFEDAFEGRPRSFVVGVEEEDFAIVLERDGGPSQVFLLGLPEPELQIDEL